MVLYLIIGCGYLPDKKPVSILITSGASCPDAVVEEIIRKVSGYYSVEALLDNYL